MSHRRLAVFAFALAWLLSGCDPSLERARSLLRIGYAVEAPYAFVKDGVVTGEAPETAKVLAQRLHLGHIEWRQIEFDHLFEELLHHRIDVVAAGTFVTPDRQKIVAFSLPTFRVREAVLLKAGNPKGWTTFQRQGSSETFRYAVLGGAAEISFLRERGWPVDSLVVVPDAATGLASVREGSADGLVLSAPSLRFMLTQVPPRTLEVRTDARDTDPGALGAFAFRPEDKALREAWDQSLAEYLNTPEHQALLAPLGFTVLEKP